jgi:hypothetical protein
MAGVERTNEIQERHHRRLLKFRALFQNLSEREYLVNTASTRSEARLILTSAGIALPAKPLEQYGGEYFARDINQADAAIVSAARLVTLFEH